MATLALRLDRVKGTANVVSQDRIYIRDEAVAVTIEGFANGEESLAPCLQVMHGRFAVAEAMITVTPSNDGAAATATLNTNTRQLVDAFCGCSGATMHQLQFRIFSTTSQKPIAIGVCSVWNFTSGEGEPSNLPSASEVLGALQTTVSNHIADKENPHEVTKAQLGLGNVDNTADADKPVSTATQTALNTLSGVLGNAITTETNQRQTADTVLQQQISAHGNAISNNRTEALQAIAAEANARSRADEQVRGEFNEVKERVRDAIESIDGKQDALDSDQLAAVNSGITAGKISSIDSSLSSLGTSVSNLGSSKQNKLNLAQTNAVNSGIDVYKVAKIAENAQALQNKADLVNGKVPQSQLPPLLAEGSVQYDREQTLTDAQKAQARQNIGAMSADTPIPDVLGKLPLRALPKYLHYLAFDDTYPADAAWLYAQLGPSDLGRCSAVRRGGKLWRNYDWTFDDAAEFIVRMSRTVAASATGASQTTRFASVGVASVGSRLTENDVMSAVNSRYYKCLPGMTLDGINEKGVVCEINVDGGPKDGWHGSPDNDGIHILAAVRWVLDHGETARQAAAFIAVNIIAPDGEMNFHFMVADETETYIVENGEMYSVTDGVKVLTNYALYDSAHAGGGKERYQLLADGEDISAVNFTNAYKPGNDWHSDFESAAQHAEAIRQWAEQGADKEAHRGKTTSSGKAWWQSVHTTEYDFAAKTMKVAVQEVDDWYTFAVDQANVDLSPIEAQLAELQSCKRDRADNTCHKTEFGEFKCEPKFDGRDVEVSERYSDLQQEWIYSITIEGIILDHEVAALSERIGGTLEFEFDGVSFTATRAAVCTDGKKFVTDDVAAKQSDIFGSDGKPTDTFATELLGKQVANAKVRYALATASSATMADRTVNILTMTQSETLTFPTATTHDNKTYARDFLLKLTYTSGTMELPQGVTKVGDELSFEAGKTYLIAFTEIAANKFYVRAIDITEAQA